MNQSKKDSKYMNMKSLTLCVIDILKSSKNTTTDEIINEVVKQLSDAHPNDHITNDLIKRRIYDIINILSASNAIKRDKKNIIYLGSTSEHNDPQNSIARMQIKEKILKEKLAILTIFKAIIQRNFQTPEPEKKYFLPLVIVSTPNQNDSSVILSSDKTEIQFESKEISNLLSFGEIAQKLDIKFDLIESFLNSSDQFVPYSNQLLNSFKYDDNFNKNDNNNIDPK